MARSLETLFERYRRGGDTAALGSVFDRTAPELFRIALHLTRDPHGAEEVLQETFLTAIEQRERFEASRRLMPWLTGILTNHARRLARARMRTPDPARLAVRRDADGPAPRMDLDGDVLRAVERLKAPYREVVLLHLRHDLRPAEIAVVTDRGPGTVRSQLHRGLEQLRARLAPGARASLVPGLTLAAGPDAVRGAVLAEAARAVPGAATAATTAPPIVGAAGVWKNPMAAAAAGVLLFGVASGLVRLTSGGPPSDRAADAAASGTLQPAAPTLRGNARVVQTVSDAETASDGADASETAPTAASPVSAAVPSGEIAGRAVLPDGTPVPGLRIEAFPGGTMRPGGTRGDPVVARTDADGRFAFTFSGSERVDVGVVTVSRALYWSVRATQVPLGTRDVLLEVPLHVVRVHVVDERGRPVGGAEVEGVRVHPWSVIDVPAWKRGDWRIWGALPYESFRRVRARSGTDDGVATLALETDAPVTILAHKGSRFSAIAFVEPHAGGGLDDVVLRGERRHGGTGAIRAVLSVRGGELPARPRLSARLFTPEGAPVSIEDSLALAGRPATLRGIPAGRYRLRLRAVAQSARGIDAQPVPVDVDVEVQAGETTDVHGESPGYPGRIDVTLVHPSGTGGDPVGGLAIEVRPHGGVRPWLRLGGWRHEGRGANTQAGLPYDKTLTAGQRLVPGRYEVRVLRGGQFLMTAWVDVPSGGTGRVRLPVAR